MKAIFKISILCGLAALSTAAAVDDSERLLQAGHAAFARGDYAGAAALYERAELYSTEPARVVFYLAGAKYQLAARKKGTSPELLEAEKLYRCCLDPTDERRSLALYGLGNCLLRKAGVRDTAALRTAIACYDQCLRDAGANERLAADARYNREKARLLLLQFQPPPPDSRSDQPSNDEEEPPSPPNDRQRNAQTSLGEQDHDGSADSQTDNGAGKPDEGTATTESSDSPSPGKGNLPPVPDEVEVPPLSPREAAEHLERAARRISRERHTFHRGRKRHSTTEIKDW